ncbi:MAG: hypothetical protein DCF25_19490 [Leptolyngbya foveolarum]|uniref:Uncharacterized protein n=1 Tax=Leptolyngbya foveolarum TaxID=47253 RepID=A0A2W4VWW3_9CYAN|nr:MAG: hypothetical protein DCF25_19490 [Leptolyngbya foveolarum]
MQLSGTSTERIQAQAVVSGIGGGSSAIGQLPSPSQITSQYQDWQLRYLRLGSVSRIIVPLSAGEHESLSNRYTSDPKACQQKAKLFL